MTPPTIDILRVEGSHREVGRQLGEMGRDRIQDELATAFDDLPAARSRDQQLALAAGYRDLTRDAAPLVDR